MISPFAVYTKIAEDIWSASEEEERIEKNKRKRIRFAEHALYKVPVLLEKHISMSYSDNKKHITQLNQQKSVSLYSQEAGILIPSFPWKAVRFATSS